MHELYELKEMLCKELEELGQKGELTAGSLDTVDKLAHAIKNLDKIIEKYEEEEGYSMRGGSYGYERSYEGGQGGGGGSYRGGHGGGSYRGGGSYNRGGSYEGGRRSYARGRGRNASRDSMGRYSSEGGYSREGGKEEMIEQLSEIMEQAPDDKSRKEIQKLIEKMEMA